MKTVNIDDVLKILHKYGEYIFVTDEKRYSFMVDEIANLEALEQKGKIGRWREDANKIDAQFCRHTYICSECGKYAEYFISGTEVWWDRIKPNFCPNCGAKMEVSKIKEIEQNNLIQGKRAGIFDFVLNENIKAYESPTNGSIFLKT